jgi:hypothetical protein
MCMWSLMSEPPTIMDVLRELVYSLRQIWRMWRAS